MNSFTVDINKCREGWVQVTISGPGASELTEDRIRAALSAPKAEAEEPCPVCAKPFAAGDTCATDIELGKCHAECLAGSPTVDLETGEPVDGPIGTFPHVALTDEAVERAVELTYRNWRGKVSTRRLSPERIWYGSTEWHPEPQWLLRAYDHEKQAHRDFALKDFGVPALTDEAVERATHRHKKRGSEYVLIGIGKMQASDWFDLGPPPEDDQDSCVDMREVAIYRSATDPTEIWVRPREEFEDGRFEAVVAVPSKGEGE